MYSKLMKVCSMIIVLALLINLLPMQILGAELSTILQEDETDKTVSSIQQKVIKGSEPAEIVGEVIENRTKFSKEFKLSNGLHMAIVYPEAVHYEEAGQWKDIDNTLKAVGSGTNGTYTNRAGAWNVSFPQQLSHNNQVSVSMNGYTVSFGMAGELRTSDLAVKGNGLMTAEMDDNITGTISAVNRMQTSYAQIQELDYAVAKAQVEFPEIVQEKLNSRLVYSDVYENTDIIYDLTASQLKESIVLNAYDASVLGYRYTLNTGDLVPILNNDGSIDLVKPNSGDTIMTMPAPYMIDNVDVISTDVEVSLEQDGDTYVLTYRMPMEWLADSQRAWPVVLDPVVTATSHWSNILDVFISEKIAPNYNSGALMAGYMTNYGKARTFIQYVNLPELTSADVIVNASLSLMRLEGTAITSYIEAHKVLDTWHSQTITWANQPDYDPIVEDYAAVGSGCTRSYWDITDVAKGWYAGENTGVMLKVSNEVESGPTHCWQQFYSIEYNPNNANILPYLSIVFRNSNGLESYWDYTSTSSGRAGAGYVNNYTGNLTWVHSDIGFGGNRMPVSISHIYNTNDSALNTYGMGYGWKTNFNQSVKVWDQNNSYYVWEDGDGTKHYFLYESSGTYKDEDGLELTLTTTGSGNTKYKIVDKYGNASYFDTSGRLTSMVNNQATPSSITITYQSTSSNLISKITDGVGRAYNFTYTNGLLTRISYVGKGTTEIAYVTFGYTGSQLTSITDQDGKTSNYTYTSNLLTTAEDIDGYKIQYAYSSGTPKRVVGISEYDGTVAGGTLAIEYAHNQTTFTDHNGHIQITQFNDWGNAISVQDGQGRAQYVQYARNNYDDTTNKGNQLTLSSKMQNTVSNLISDSSIETGNLWHSNTSTVTINRSTAAAYLGNYSLEVIATASGASNGAYYPYVYVDPGETITFSAYVKAVGTPVQLAFHCMYEDYNFVIIGDVVQATGDWVRMNVSYTNTEDITLRLVGYLFLKQPGVAYIDCAQAEIAPTPSRYNLIQNGDFSNTSAWSASGGRTNLDNNDIAAPQLDGNVYAMTGNPSSAQSISQTVNVSGSEGDTFVLGGWAKGDAVPLTDENRTFGLKLTFHYTDGSTSSQTVSFNTACDSQVNWQYAATPAVAQKAYSSVTVQVMYDYNANTVYFDGIQLFKEEFGSSYTYDDDGNIISVTDLQKQTTNYEYDTSGNLTKILQDNKAKMTYTYDAYHNVLTATSAEGVVYEFGYDAYGNNTSVSIVNSDTKMTSTATYSADGNVLVSTKDTLDKITTYGYNVDTNLLEWVQYPEDTEATRTEYTYDTMYRLASAAAETSSGSSLTASYTYTDDLLTSIETASTTYNFAYGDFSLASSISIGDRTLATYSYTNDRNRYLDKLTYGNGDFVQYTYDDYGRVTKETFEDGSTVTYAYDNSGALATVTDSETGIKTTYYYDFTDRLMKYVESGTNYSHSVGYEYDTLNNLTLLVETINGVEHTTTYTYDDDNRVVSVSDDNASRSYEYDDYGRLSGRTTVDGTASVFGEVFTYYNRDSGNATNQVSDWSAVSDSYEKHVSYEYDDNGNITAIWEGDRICVEYTYDSANQLIQEVNHYVYTCWSWTYDDAGNIIRCEESNYDTCEFSRTYYTYSDAAWGDLLTYYNGNAITYDGIGNPLSDGIWTYTWKQGRQLATMSNGTTTWTYTYDANGMRTKRTNGTTTYTYVYNGSQLVQMTVGNDTLYFSYDAYGHPMSLTYNGTVYYYIVNVPGDVIAILDENGSAVVEYVYDAWGNIHSITGSMASTLGTLNPLRYRGYVYDTETELYYLQSRYYNPEWGRFLNADSYISTGQGFLGSNMFAYCLNNPVNFIDPTGHIVIVDDIVIWGGLAIVAVAALLLVPPPIVTQTPRVGFDTQHPSSSFGKESVTQDQQTADSFQAKGKSKSLPKTGDPNSRATLENDDGTIKQERYYNSSGNPQFDIDHNHSDGDGSHTFPHVHVWRNHIRGIIPLDYSQFYYMLIEFI